ncbi:MAG: hypothetical protein OSB44_08270 [Verrucomicrobiales bacterium]|nr:hypothetical protein [Verrucomicrobiales bacterium]
MRILSLLLILFATCSTNVPAQNEATPPKVFNAPNGKSFPAHWGQPPLGQTRDLRILPGGYGRGSGTLARWIQENLEADAKDPGRAKGKKNPKDQEIKKLEKEIAQMKKLLITSKFNTEGLAKYMARLKKKTARLAQLKASEKGKIPSFEEWLKGGKKIPKGMIFTGGSPWFNESTGKNRSPEQVYKMIFKKNPKK